MLQLVSLLKVRHTECVKVLGAANLEFDHILVLLDLDSPGILPSGCQKEILDLVDLLRLKPKKGSVKNLHTRIEICSKVVLSKLHTQPQQINWQ